MWLTSAVHRLFRSNARMTLISHWYIHVTSYILLCSLLDRNMLTLTVRSAWSIMSYSAMLIGHSTYFEAIYFLNYCLGVCYRLILNRSAVRRPTVSLLILSKCRFWLIHVVFKKNISCVLNRFFIHYIKNLDPYTHS